MYQCFIVVTDCWFCVCLF